MSINRASQGPEPPLARAGPQNGPLERVRMPTAGKGWGVIVYGLATAGLGVIGLLCGDFTIVWHPVPDILQGQAWLAYACAALFALAGLGVQRPSLVLGAAAILCALYFLFALSWLRRVVAYPLLIGTWLGFSEQLALALGAIVAAVIARRASGTAVSACRIAFGLCELVFGLAHFLSLPETVAMTPEWLPLGQTFWAIATGAAHLLAGGALIAGVRPDLAARLLTGMFLAFGAFVWAPQIFVDPLAAFPWAGGAITLALAGAVWALADLMTSQRHETRITTTSLLQHSTWPARIAVALSRCRRGDPADTLLLQRLNLDQGADDMTHPATERQPKRWSEAGTAILLAGFAAGLADFLFASIESVLRGNSPLGPWKGVARALLGPASQDNGIGLAMLGAGLHFFICFGAAALLYLIMLRQPWFVRRPIVTGVLFGIGFLIVMNYVILPRSYIRHSIYPLDGIHITAFWHIVLIGIPTAWVLSRRMRG